MHLTQRAIEILRAKGHEITEEEKVATQIAILLHDIGHGPFSHALENTVVKGIHHEELSTLFMERINKEFDGKLTMAISIFTNNYPKKFLHDLISSQLDMDRLDYLRRDSFYTGVTEGAINSERLLTMLNVHNDHLVIDSKGIYSVEKFIVARRLMYWQVYLHKTVLSAEFMLVNILRKARNLALNGESLFASSPLKLFLNNQYTLQDFKADPNLLDQFAKLDDYDILGAIKEWAHHGNDALRLLSQMLVDRKLLKIELQNEAFSHGLIEQLKQKVKDHFNLQNGEENFFIIQEQISNHAYNNKDFGIQLLNKQGEARDILDASDQLDMNHLTKVVTKHFVCYPAEIV
jgi:HD superfamily phosphohydrolase